MKAMLVKLDSNTIFKELVEIFSPISSCIKFTSETHEKVIINK